MNKYINKHIESEYMNKYINQNRHKYIHKKYIKPIINFFFFLKKTLVVWYDHSSVVNE